MKIAINPHGSRHAFIKFDSVIGWTITSGSIAKHQTKSQACTLDGAVKAHENACRQLLQQAGVNAELSYIGFRGLRGADAAVRAFVNHLYEQDPKQRMMPEFGYTREELDAMIHPGIVIEHATRAIMDFADTLRGIKREGFDYYAEVEKMQEASESKGINLHRGGIVTGSPEGCSGPPFAFVAHPPEFKEEATSPPPPPPIYRVKDMVIFQYKETVGMDCIVFPVYPYHSEEMTIAVPSHEWMEWQQGCDHRQAAIPAPSPKIVEIKTPTLESLTKDVVHFKGLVAVRDGVIGALQKRNAVLDDTISALKGGCDENQKVANWIQANMPDLIHDGGAGDAAIRGLEELLSLRKDKGARLLQSYYVGPLKLCEDPALRLEIHGSVGSGQGAMANALLTTFREELVDPDARRATLQRLASGGIQIDEMERKR